MLKVLAAAIFLAAAIAALPALADGQAPPPAPAAASAAAPMHIAKPMEVWPKEGGGAKAPHG